MQILVYGFQRSGTTLLRRIISLHPDVKRMFHEISVLKRTEENPRMLRVYLKSQGIDIKRDNWGEKVPYYKKSKNRNPVAYCQKWLDTFNRYGKIIHIIRHPYDTAFSIVKKYNGINVIGGPLKVYSSMVSKVLDVLEGNDCVLNVKYEDLLTKPDEIIYMIYDFCGLKPDIDFRYRMEKIKNPKYQSINPNRAFAYKKKKFKVKTNLRPIINRLNKIDGVKYDLWKHW